MSLSEYLCMDNCLLLLKQSLNDVDEAKMAWISGSVEKVFFPSLRLIELRVGHKINYQTRYEAQLIIKLALFTDYIVLLLKTQITSVMF